MKKIIWTLLGASVLALGWYLAIRSFEFEVNFKAKTLPGDIIQTIRIWDRSLANAEIAEVDSFYGVRQNIVWDDHRYVFNWYFESVDDSTTHVNVTISEPGRTIINKLLVPFTDQYIERHARDIVQEFYEVLKMHLEITEVSVVGESETTPSFCVCRNMKTSQIEKANGMMRDYGLLTSFISTFNLKEDGFPLIQVREWNHSLGQLKFDFCFPVLKTDGLPASDSITYRELKRDKVLKAVYHGNYITSDRAWYALIRFAEANGYEINGLPIEYFYNNPNLGINEKDWRVDVYLPIK